MAEYVQWFWKNHLEEHFREEEQILAPYLPGDNVLLQQMLEEHQQIEATIHINENIPDATLLGNLAQAIDDHIRFEERQLFPYAEKMIPENELNLIYEGLSKEPRNVKNGRTTFGRGRNIEKMRYWGFSSLGARISKFTIDTPVNCKRLRPGKL